LTVCKRLKTIYTRMKRQSSIPEITRVFVTAFPCLFTASHDISRMVSVEFFLIVNIDIPSSRSSISNSSLGIISTPFSYQWTLGFGVPFTRTTRRFIISSSSSSSSHMVSVCNSVSKYGDFPILISFGSLVSFTSCSSAIKKKKIFNGNNS